MSRKLPKQLHRCAWLACLLVGGAATTWASTYTVTNLNDSGSGSLRAAMTSASADPAGNIVFASGVAGTINLQSSLPYVNVPSGTMTITGPGANRLTISGQGKYQVMVLEKGNLTISGVTIADGYVGAGGGYPTDPGWGAAFYTSADTILTLENDILANNVTTAGGGGAILSEGILNVTNSTFTGNSVTSYTGGGAIFNLGALNVTGSTFSFNTAVNEGSVILNYGASSASATIVNSTFANNVVPPGGGGGGLYNESGATLTVRNSTFSGNLPATGGSIANAGAMTLTNNVIAEPTAYSYQCTAAPAPAGQCPANPSSPDANGNFDEAATSLSLLPLGYYGSLTQTILPQVGSALICGGSSAGALSVSGQPLASDQRGFGLDAGCATGKVDAGAVQTSYLTVTTNGDNGNGTCGASCTLRDAIARANAAGFADIAFAKSVTGTITLASALPAVSGMANIVGPGANLLTVSGNNASQIFNVTNGTLDISGLSIVNGKSASNGGAIENANGLVTLTNAAVSNSSATSDGGAIDNHGVVLASDTTFSGNKASLGSAIYNAGAVNAAYSTFANNAASGMGGIYNNSGAALTLANATFAANTGGTGPGIDNLGSLSVTNSVLDASAECAGSGCPASGNGNVITAGLAALGSYGGPTLTVLPQPGSAAICGGSSTLIPVNALTDQRGFANENLTYTGYSATAPCVDSGAVQTNYTAVQFAGTGPYVATAGKPGTTPAIVVSVTESGQNIGGVPVTLTFNGTGSATGLTATTLGGTGATFSSFQATTAAASGDTVSVNLPVVGSEVLAAAPVALTVNPGVAAFTMSVNPPSQTLYAGSLAIFLVQLQASKGFNSAVTLNCSGGPAGSSCITLPSTVTFYNGQGWALAGLFLPSNAASGNYSVTFSGAAGGAASSATAKVTVQQSPGWWGWWW
ncbi:MAG: beta strand repeat-containing protein [Acidobacteriota bacterium]